MHENITDRFMNISDKIQAACLQAQRSQDDVRLVAVSKLQSIEVIKDVINGPGHFLGHTQTLDVMQTEYVYPLVGDRLSPDDWKDAGSLDVRQRANKVVKEILEGPLPTHIPPDSDSLIREMFTIHLPSRN